MSAQIYDFKTREQFNKDRFKKIKEKAEIKAIAVLKDNDKPMPAEYGWFLDTQKKLEENPKFAYSLTEKESDIFFKCSEYHILFNMLSLSFIPDLIANEKGKK